MVFTLMLEECEVSCCLSGFSLVVLCIDEEHYRMLKKCEAALLSVARKELRDGFTTLRFYVERG